MLAAAAYFQDASAGETEIGQLADSLYLRVDWLWILGAAPLVCHGWTPEHRVLKWHWEGYDEALILYTLALGSPTFPIPDHCYSVWSETYRWRTIYGIEYLYAGPLFIHQLSHVWIDFRGIRDQIMQ